MNELLKIDSIDKACINALLENPRGSWRELRLANVSYVDNTVETNLGDFNQTA